MKNYWIYFIQSGHGPVKIGLSRDPKWRMKTLQIGNPEKLELVAAMPGSRRDEQALHKRFEASHIHSEWFRLTQELEDLIASLGVPNLSKVKPHPDSIVKGE